LRTQPSSPRAVHASDKVVSESGKKSFSVHGDSARPMLVSRCTENPIKTLLSALLRELKFTPASQPVSNRFKDGQGWMKAAAAAQSGHLPYVS
jgi:hypothetical protein